MKYKSRWNKNNNTNWRLQRLIGFSKKNCHLNVFRIKVDLPFLSRCNAHSYFLVGKKMTRSAQEDWSPTLLEHVRDDHCTRDGIPRLGPIYTRIESDELPSRMVFLTTHIGLFLVGLSVVHCRPFATWRNLKGRAPERPWNQKSAGKRWPAHSSTLPPTPMRRPFNAKLLHGHGNHGTRHSSPEARACTTPPELISERERMRRALRHPMRRGDSRCVKQKRSSLPTRDTRGAFPSPGLSPASGFHFPKPDMPSAGTPTSVWCCL
jgi:hypothetical protein